MILLFIGFIFGTAVGVMVFDRALIRALDELADWEKAGP